MLARRLSCAALVAALAACTTAPRAPGVGTPAAVAAPDAAPVLKEADEALRIARFDVAEIGRASCRERV